MPTDAISKGSGYWCSAGKHSPAQTVTWTGSLGAAQSVLGVKISWAYSPGEFKILTSADGGNFEEAACWRATSRGEASYQETVLFDRPRSAKAVTLAMRSPMPWGYFGLNDVALLVEPGPVMLVSGTSSASGELCLVTSGSTLSARPCLEAIAGGAGDEVFAFNDEAQLVTVKEGGCVALAGGDVTAGGKLIVQDCEEAAEANDGRSNFAFTPGGQLSLPSLGNFCVALTGSAVSVRDCGAAGAFFQASVPQLDLGAAGVAKDQAALLRAAASRQGDILSKLEHLLPLLDTCHFALLGNATSAARVKGLALVASTLSNAGAAGEPAADAVGLIYQALGIDVESTKALIAKSGRALAAASSKAGSGA